MTSPVIHNDPAAFDAELAAHPVVQVYSGAHGCACGCRGNYSKTPASITRTTNKIRRMIESGEATTIMVWPGKYVAIDTATRSYTAYTGPEYANA